MEELVCPNCNAPLGIENQFGQTLTCKFCGSSFLVPDRDATNPADNPSQPTSTDQRGTALQSVITGLAPLPPRCVLRASGDEVARTLTITGENFPTTHHGLQFSRVDDGRLSLIFDMEVNWGSTTRVTVDMDRIKHALWDDARLPLRLRLMDTENADYRPRSDWSVEFILANNAAACRKS